MADIFSDSRAVFLFALSKEEEAAAFYQDLADKASTDHMREAFLDLAAQERGHQNQIRHILEKEAEDAFSPGPVTDLLVSDYLEPVAPGPGMSFQDALIVAMKREQVAVKLYTDVASVSVNPKVKEALSTMAREEAAHKHKLEEEYEIEFRKEN